jgi:hypothetical protein
MLKQMLVTFHGGMVAIGYEWGTMDHPKGLDASPDNNVHKEIGQTMSRVAGAFRRENAYPAAPMNSLVYPVHGGMEVRSSYIALLVVSHSIHGL